ncbi:hypothetical protein ACTACG_06120 [Pseudomonas syringae]|uniref:hypothetical protein n=1 Tax=Pseudomonas syringae TaxID=317 RepID=UPI000465D718|nr:hypothetical protein [Pseudomonas syringae]
MRHEKLTVEDVFVVVKRLYEKAIGEMGFRPEQAFAYVQDEVDSLVGKEELIMNFIIQTAIYSEGAKRGVKLSKDSPYAEDMLDFLADTYGCCNRDQLKALDVSLSELEGIISKAELVSREFLECEWV